MRRAPSGRWRAEWRDPSGRKRSLTFRRQADARAHLAKLEADKLRGLYLDPSRGRLSLAEHFAETIARDEHRLAASTLDLYRRHWRLYLEPSLGDRRLSTITRADVEGVIGALLARGVGVTTVRAVYKLTARLLEVAVHQDRLARNVARGVELPRARTKEKRALETADILALADVVDDRWHAGILVLGFCGLRIGELAGLRSTSVDFLRKRIHVVEQLVEVAGELHRTPTKTRETRAVPVPGIVLEALAEHMGAFPPRDEVVFYGRDGGPIRRNVWRRRVFTPAVHAAGLAPLSPHELRHTAVSQAIAEGADLKIVQQIAGHSSAAVTADVYGHLLASAADAVAERIDARARQAADRRQEAAETDGTGRKHVAGVASLTSANGKHRR